MAKLLLCLVAALCIASVVADSNCQYGYNQVWDVKRVSGTCKTQGGVCTVFDFQPPFVDPYDAGVRVNAVAGQYYNFIYSSDPAYPLGLNLYNQDGTLNKVVAASGNITVPGDTGMLYVGKLGACGGSPRGCGTGYFIARNGGLAPVSSTQFTFNVIAVNPTMEEILYKYRYDFCTDDPKYITTSSTTTTTPAPSMEDCKLAFPEQFKTISKNAIKDPIGSAIQGAIDATGLKMAALDRVQASVTGKQANLKGALPGLPPLPVAIPTLFPKPSF